MKDIENKDIQSIVKLMYSSFHKAERKIADYILALKKPIGISVVVLAEMLDVSEATVIRFCKRIGVSGYAELKLCLAQQLAAGEIRQDPYLFDMPIEEKDTIDVVPRKMIASVRSSLADLENTILPEELEQAVQALKNARMVYLFGVVHSAAVCADLNCRLLKVGIPSQVYSDSHLQFYAAQNVQKEDVVVAISHSGVTVDVVDAARIAKERGATVICISNCLNTPLTRVSDIRLLTGGHEVAFNSETMTSHISQLVIIDMLYIGIILSDYPYYTKLVSQINDTMLKKAY